MDFIFIVMLVPSVLSLVIMRFTRPRRCDMPCCVRCRYILRGIQHPQCPECGLDLHVMGIVRPGYGRNRPKWVVFLVWSLNVHWLAICLLPAKTRQGGNDIDLIIFFTIWLIGLGAIVAMKSFSKPPEATMNWDAFKQSKRSGHSQKDESAAKNAHTPST